MVASAATVSVWVIADVVSAELRDRRKAGAVTFNVVCVIVAV